jgi:ribonuclease P protein component
VRRSLRTRRQFTEVYDGGRKAVGRTLIAFVLCRTPPLDPSDPASEGGFAIGVVASRKVGPAHRRNRAKRVLRAALQPLVARLRRPVWIVLVARSAAADPDIRSHDVRAELESLLVRLDMLSPVSSPSSEDSQSC